MTVGLIAALVGMFGYGIGSVLQAAAAARASGPAVLRHPAYLAGLTCDAVAWLASLAALRSLPLFVVQSLLAGELPMPAPIAQQVRAVLSVMATLATLATLAENHQKRTKC